MRLINADSLREKAETCRETTDAFIELIDMEPTVVPGTTADVNDQCEGQVTWAEAVEEATNGKQ